MNRKSLIAALVLAATAAGASAESYEEYNTPFVSAGSGAAVVYQRGGVNPWSTSYNPLAQFRSTQTRGQVTADYVSAREVVNAFTGEDSGSGYLAGRPAAAGETRLARIK
jgi:hypothetical protein